MAEAERRAKLETPLDLWIYSSSSVNRDLEGIHAPLTCAAHTVWFNGIDALSYQPTCKWAQMHPRDQEGWRRAGEHSVTLCPTSCSISFILGITM